MAFKSDECKNTTHKQKTFYFITTVSFFIILKIELDLSHYFLINYFLELIILDFKFPIKPDE